MWQTLKDRWRRMVFLEHKPEAGEICLNQRRVFTLPGKAGLALLALLLVLFIASTNYNLSLGFALTFLLGGVAAVNIFLTFRNLAYLYLQAGPATPVFAGEAAEFPLLLKNRKTWPRYAIWVGLHTDPSLAHAVDIPAGSEAEVTLSCATSERGWQAAPRIRLQTWFPLGLLRAWSTWLPDVQVLVYPRPESNPPPLPVSGEQASGQLERPGGDDFAGVRAYQSGDPLKHLAWKQIARVSAAGGNHLFSKMFVTHSGADIVLDFASLPQRMDLELRLARMASWVLQAEQLGLPYAFRLGADDFAPACGPAHQHACLQALALYEGA